MLRNTSFFRSPNDSDQNAKTTMSEEQQKAALVLNEQLRTEIKNKSIYFKSLIGQKNIDAFLKNTENKPDIHSYEKLHAKMINEGKTQCSDYAGHPCVERTGLIIGIAVIVGVLTGTCALTISMMCCHATVAEGACAAEMSGGIGAAFGGLGAGLVGPPEDNIEQYYSHQQERQEITAYAQEFQSKYLKIMAAPETQTMEDVPLLPIRFRMD